MIPPSHRVSALRDLALRGTRYDTILISPYAFEALLLIRIVDPGWCECVCDADVFRRYSELFGIDLMPRRVSVDELMDIEREMRLRSSSDHHEG